MLSKYRLDEESAASVSGPDSGKVLWCHYGPAAGGWDACTNTCGHSQNRRVYAHTNVRERVCVLYLFTQHTSTSAPKWNSPLQDLCQSQHIFITCQGSGSGKRAVSPLLSFLLSPLSVLSFRGCDKQKWAIHSIMITHMTLSDLHSFHV